MSLIQKKVFCILILLCTVLVLGACSPDPDPVVPTTTIVIKNIPASILNTKNGSTDITGKPTFKVYVQLSSGITADSVSTAMGDVEVTAADKSGDWVTVTIPVYKPKNNRPATDSLTEAHKPDTTKPNDSTTWSGVAVVISPEAVKDIFDIDCKVGYGSSSSSSTVTFDWTTNLKTKTLMNVGADGIDNYKRIYGKIGFYDGVVVTDDDVTGVPCDSCECDISCKCSEGYACRAGGDINNFSQFRTTINDHQQ